MFISNSDAYLLPGILPMVHITFNVVKQQVCDIYGISIEMLHFDTRKKEICEPRQVCMFLGRTYLKMTLHECAISFNKDHATVLYSARVVPDRYRYNSDFRNTMQSVLRRIGIDHSSFKYLSW